MTNNIPYSSGISINQPNIDTTLIKIFLNTVKEGDLQLIIQEINKYHFDVKLLKDSQYDQNALFYAALIKNDEDCLNVMRYFIDELGVDCKTKDKIQQTVLYYVCREGKINTCNYLLTKNIPLNDVDLYQQTPVYYACRENRLSVLQALVEHGADVNVEDKYGQTCLFYAIREGHIDIVDYLTSLDEFTKIDKADKKGLTPYLFAIKHCKQAIVELLVNKGASMGKATDTKKTKNKKVKQQEEEKIEEDLQKPKRFVLCKINEHGEKSALTLEEIAQFKEDHPDVAEALTNQALLEQMEENAPEELKNFDSWEKVAKKLVNALWKFKDSEIFHKPVNPMELGIPDYFDIIQNPMDFSTIKKNLNNCTYRNCQEFCEDMNLVFRAKCYWGDM